jgi:hypothetical protein
VELLVDANWTLLVETFREGLIAHCGKSDHR